MANIVNLKVASCNKNQKGGYVIKLVDETTKILNIFGMSKTVVIKRSYYIGNMPQPLVIGQVFAEDMDKFRIVQRPCALLKDENNNIIGTTSPEMAQKSGKSYQIIMTSWLHAA